MRRMVRFRGVEVHTEWPGCNRRDYVLEPDFPLAVDEARVVRLWEHPAEVDGKRGVPVTWLELAFADEYVTVLGSLSETLERLGGLV